MSTLIHTRPALATRRLHALHVRSLGLIAAALLLALPIGPARSQDDPVVAKVNGVEVRQSDLAMAEEDMGQQAQALTGDARRDYLVSYVSDVTGGQGGGGQEGPGSRRVQEPHRLHPQQAADGNAVAGGGQGRGH
jgi:hypothetical protein